MRGTFATCDNSPHLRAILAISDNRHFTGTGTVKRILLLNLKLDVVIIALIRHPT